MTATLFQARRLLVAGTGLISGRDWAYQWKGLGLSVEETGLISRRDWAYQWQTFWGAKIE